MADKAKAKMNNVWDVYPRPQLVRKDWMNLNGEWKFSIGDGQDKAARSGRIIVPFCPESALSGQGLESDYGKYIGKKLIYEKSVVIPDEWIDYSADQSLGKRVILHFGAVDQEATVYINGKEAGSHKSGYLPFSIDITKFLKFDETKEKATRIKVVAEDRLDHKYPWGKQKIDRGGMWYTPVSGIWQSVWLEPVPEEHIASLKIDTGLDWVEIRAYGIESGTIELLGEKHRMNKDEAASSPCASVHIDIHHPHIWTPEDPYLYEFKITAGDEPEDGKKNVADSICSYFALRTLDIRELDGYQRLCLNGEPYFFNGLLDQGYWQDGIYTPCEPELYAEDIRKMKALGFNTLRKHIKIEPEQFYYDCDRLGMVVFQDMVNNGDYSFFHDSVLPTIGFTGLGDRNGNSDAEAREIFLSAMEDTVKHLYNHPSVCYWTIFNEGWGQFCADDAYDKLKALDGTRFIDATSGWFRRSKSDVDSHHVYFKKIKLKAGRRPLVLSEFGGYACKLSEHCFNKEKTYGYRKCADEAVLLSDMGRLYDEEVLPLIGKGLCAAIYTQVSDVEDETNGILTYDRELTKFDSYVGTGRVEIIGNHTDHQGGCVLACPTKEKIRAYVADNHAGRIRVYSEGFPAVDVDISGGNNQYEKGTTKAILVGLLTGFADLYGAPDAKVTESDVGNAPGFDKPGFDIHIKSEVAVGSGLSSSAAFEILLARIINYRMYGGRADAVQIAKIGQFAENAFYGKPCGLQDQLAISLGRLVLMNFSTKEPEYEFIDYDFSKSGYRMRIIGTDSDHADLGAEFASIPEDMFTVAGLMGLERLGDISRERFLKRVPELEQKVKEGVITELQLNRARHFYDETERVVAGATSLQAGNIERFLACINASGRSSEELLQNILPEGVKENNLSRTLNEYRARPTTAALKLEGGGFGGSVMVWEEE